MTDPIPYATETRPALTARELFGVVVRTLGLLLMVWGLYCFAYVVIMQATSRPSDANAPIAHALFAIFYCSAGIILLKGGWIVHFAYGRKY